LLFAGGWWPCLPNVRRQRSAVIALREQKVAELAGSGRMGRLQHSVGSLTELAQPLVS
jgi:hypothetical protein